jgi:hypothetical protein
MRQLCGKNLKPGAVAVKLSPHEGQKLRRNKLHTVLLRIHAAQQLGWCQGGSEQMHALSHPFQAQE